MVNYKAEVVKLVDTQVSGTCGGNPVEVQVLSSAPGFVLLADARRTTPWQARLLITRCIVHSERSLSRRSRA
jgi:hypothetical protein